jgi:hypothetical protein
MNIFVVDKCPTTAAIMLCDKHIVKMILESAQMLCTAYGEGAPYKPAFKNHPCTKWVRQSQQNYNWLCQHAQAMCAEYERRYKRTHKSQAVISLCSKLATLPDIGLTPFAQAMPDQYKDANAVVAYRNYYKGEKSKIAVWKHCSPPSWWTHRDGSS